MELMGEEHSDTIVIMKNFADMLRMLGRHDEARKLMGD